ncbi:LysM peptidoglycan-binding domain-containing protein [Hymenobacter sp. BT683]|uniref:LysM peptidoglycan-binding domain-containing protein n=1 Tax=Hymenobacter jeongseonensis TaxID=2791027 RepID=A0ABS0IKG8_9BACT|nr:LysM peptidoglycan-binding domain-containing protein [Hymenobacter jeongseonensis]MBF9238358.1 LysM peptidoglycan-binding domain-containing protein [Hymenobacter jeongseonensis]
MRNPVTFFLLLMLALGGPLAAYAAPFQPAPPVPASFDVLGLRLVLNEEAQRLVQQKADGLMRHQPSFQARVDLADAAFPIIDRVLREEGVPLDFRYLALQESALLGDAQSVHEAVGYWQFKRETATGLGLVINDEVDERKHLTASTRAAARYLARNNASLRNWLNALLSYNTGLTGVKPYTLPTDAGATEMAITGATSPYVLAFLAHKLAFEPNCGLNPHPPLRLQEFPAVAGQTLEAQALTLHTEVANLAVHNRWLLAAAVPAGRPYSLIVPIGDVSQAAGIIANQRLQSRQELLAVPAVSSTNAAEVHLNNLRAIIALPGETIADLARRGNKRMGEFLRENELTAFDVAVTGRPYYLESKRDAGAVEYHVLQPSETVFDVAQKYGMRKKAVLAKNRMARNEELRPGRLLWLQHTRPREVAVEYRSLPEGAGLERSRPVARPAAAPVEFDQPVAIAAKPKRSSARNQRQEAEAQEGWGEALPSRNGQVIAAPAPAPVPAPASPPAAPVMSPVPVPVSPAVSIPTVAQLPPAASAPAPAPLADEPREAEPAESSPVVAAPTAEAAPIPAPAKPVVVVPAPRPAVSVPVPAAAPMAIPAAAAEASHRVEAGETVYSISRRYQIAPKALMAMNRLTLPATLAVGQVLVLNAPEPLTAAPAPQQNGRTNPAAIYSPQTPTAPAPAAMGGPVAQQHTVVKGETLYSISRRYGVPVADLQAWNNKPDGTVRIGEVLTVKGK